MRAGLGLGLGLANPNPNPNLRVMHVELPRCKLARHLVRVRG